MGCKASKYKRNYPATTVRTSSSEVKRKAREGDCAFFSQARAKLARDYILVIDRSGSMSSSDRWPQALEAVEFFAGSICDFDPSGITVILFDDKVIKFENVRDPEFVKKVFHQNPPRGSTDLAKALDTAFSEHFDGSTGATTILVVTDGSPNDADAVKAVIEKAASSISSDEELSVSFIQIGTDTGARAFLKHLDDNLNAKFDIVDVVVPSDLHEMSFADVIRKSLAD